MANLVIVSKCFLDCIHFFANLLKHRLMLPVHLVRLSAPVRLSVSRSTGLLLLADVVLKVNFAIPLMTLCLL